MAQSARPHSAAALALAVALERLSDPKKVLRLGINTAVAGWVLWSLVAGVLTWWREQAAARRFCARVWQAAHGLVEGVEEGGAGPDLSAPDAQGVYTVHGGGGGPLFVRRARGLSLPGTQAAALAAAATAAGLPLPVAGWEFSTDRESWLPVSAVDRCAALYARRGGNADRLLLRRLHVETLMAAHAPRRGVGAVAGVVAGWHLPPLDTGATRRSAEQLAAPPERFLCPLGLCLMTDPVIAPSGLSYQRASILAHLKRARSDPATGQPLCASDLYPNLVLRDELQQWLVDKDELSLRCASATSGVAGRTLDEDTARPKRRRDAAVHEVVVSAR